ncbi:hypothetical protein ABZ348_20200 [Streptomyces sp. NPDC005963]|uniref:hypothetical protein n=1 Tax=Streptomyces sp. NPDC005963 TaxID=3156721 RepID=UPI0033C0F9A9
MERALEQAASRGRYAPTTVLGTGMSSDFLHGVAGDRCGFTTPLDPDMTSPDRAPFAPNGYLVR